MSSRQLTTATKRRIENRRKLNCLLKWIHRFIGLRLHYVYELSEFEQQLEAVVRKPFHFDQRMIEVVFYYVLHFLTRLVSRWIIVVICEHFN